MAKEEREDSGAVTVKRLKAALATAGSVISLLAGGGGLAYGVTRGEAHAGMPQERQVTRAEFEEVKAQQQAFIIEVRVGMGAITTALEAQTTVTSDLRSEVKELRMGRRR